jgi:hypothetical protein
MSSNQGTGNINYSFDISNINNTIKSQKTLLFNYYLSIFISLIYLYTIRVQKYIYNDKNKDGNKTTIVENDIENYFKTITLGFPDYIMNAKSMSHIENGKTEADKNLYGLTKKSYIFIIALYVASVLIVISEYCKNSLFSILTTLIQSNENNNPYNNPNMVSKIKNDNNTEFIANNSKLFGLLLVFFVPFLIPYFIKLFGFDNYDVKTNLFAKYSVCILLLFPFIFIVLSKFGLGKHLDLLDGIDKYIEQKDVEYINKIKESYKINSYIKYTFIFIILVYVYYLILHLNIDESSWKKTGFIIFVLLILIPIILVYNNLEVVFSTFTQTNFNSKHVQKYLKNGCSNLLGLIIKYNYPCIRK